jgi:hypothetical protein
MSATRIKSRAGRTIARKRRRAMPSRSVAEMLLDLAYRMHATRVLRVLPGAESATARN